MPEPEIGSSSARRLVVGYTIGNDVSSRDIEGANPLYLPQAKVFAGACAIGPAVYVPDDWDAPLAIRMRIVDAAGAEVFAGETSTARMRRRFDELVAGSSATTPCRTGACSDRNRARASGTYTLGRAIPSRSRFPRSARW